MINPGGKILAAWYSLLNGSLPIPVYRTDAPPDAPEQYVLLRLESSTDARNNHSNVTNPVLITEIVTRFDARIDDEQIFFYDTLIGQALSSSPATHNLPIQSGIQIVTVVRRDQTVLPEDDGTYRYNRLITRNVHRVLETASVLGVFSSQFNNVFA